MFLELFCKQQISNQKQVEKWKVKSTAFINNNMNKKSTKRAWLVVKIKLHETWGHVNMGKKQRLFEWLKDATRCYNFPKPFFVFTCIIFHVKYWFFICTCIVYLYRTVYISVCQYLYWHRLKGCFGVRWWKEIRTNLHNLNKLPSFFFKKNTHTLLTETNCMP